LGGCSFLASQWSAHVGDGVDRCARKPEVARVSERNDAPQMMLFVPELVLKSSVFWQWNSCPLLEPARVGKRQLEHDVRW
jgi:hypothetical protein